jgi:hypothetical protein
MIPRLLDRRRPAGTPVPAGPEPSLDPTELALGRYGREQLTADPSRLARVRSIVLHEFARSVGVTAAPAPRRFLVARGPIHRGLVAGLGLVLLSGGAAAAYFSGPAEPFYDARLLVESMLLPEAASPSRADAQLARLEARLREAEAAVGQHDGRGLRAAIGAYDRITAELLSADRPPRLRELLRAALERHRMVLKELSTTAPSEAAAAIRAALERVEALVALDTVTGPEEVPAGDQAPGAGPPAGRPGPPGEPGGPAQGQGRSGPGGEQGGPPPEPRTP